MRGDRVFGRLVREHRRRLVITQEELASLAGVSTRSIQNLEAGRIRRPRTATVRLLADALGLRGAEREEFLAADLTAPTALRPAQLPMGTPGFVGRQAPLSLLDQALRQAEGEQSTGRGSAVVITAVSGTAGIGKTALALHWAHTVAEQFDDGQLYVNLRGFDPTDAALGAGEVIRGFLSGLGVPPERVPASFEAQVGLYRRLLAERRVLVVLDNARDAEQVRPLLPGASGCLTLVTSRNRLSGLVAAEGACPVVLDLLTDAEARDLLASRIGEARVAAEPAAVEEIVVLSARLPLALTIVAARACMNPSFPLSAITAELREAGDGLDRFSDGDSDLDIRAVFSWSYRALSAPAARLFRLLGLHPGPDCSRAAAASLAGVPPSRVRPLLIELAAAHLLTEHAPGRYTFHDLLRSYAAELVRDHDDENARRGARLRMLDHYLHSAYAGALRMQPQWVPVTPGPACRGVTPEPAAEHERVLAWFVTERPVLMASVSLAGESGFGTHAWQLAWALTTFLMPRGLWADLRTVQRAGLEAARRSREPAGIALTTRLLGTAEMRLGDPDAAEALFVQSLEIFQELRDAAGAAQTHHNLCVLNHSLGRTVQALHHGRQALRLCRLAGNRAGECRALNIVGWCHASLGEYLPALDYCRQALVVQRETGDRNGEAATLDSLGYVHHQLGEYDRAVEYFRRALVLFEATADRTNEGDTLARLGDTYHAMGQRAAAVDAWQRAVQIFEQLGVADTTALHAKLHAEHATLPADEATSRCQP